MTKFRLGIPEDQTQSGEAPRRFCRQTAERPNGESETPHWNGSFRKRIAFGLDERQNGEPLARRDRRSGTAKTYMGNPGQGHVFDAVLPSNSYIRAQLLEGFYRDAILAHFNNTPFSVDSDVMRLIEAQRQRAVEEIRVEIPTALYTYWLDLGLPDLTKLGWQELCDFRNSDVGSSFREMVHKVAGRVRGSLHAGENLRDVENLVGREFNKELLSELARRVKTPGRTIASACLNFIPFGCIPDIAMDLADFGSDATSWISLIRPYKPTVTS